MTCPYPIPSLRTLNTSSASLSVFLLYFTIGQQIDAHQAPLAAMVFSSNGLYLATASEKGTMVRVHFITQATKVKLHHSPLTLSSIWSRLISFCIFTSNSHIVFGGEHTHQQSIRWHLVHLLICLTFLLPQVHQALYTCSSLMRPEMEGTFPAFASYKFQSHYFIGIMLLYDIHFSGDKEIHCSVQ